MTKNTLTDEFDTRLEALQKGSAPKREVDAAIAIYERLRTARSIAVSLLRGPIDGNDKRVGHVSESAVLAVFDALNAELRDTRSSRTRSSKES